MSSSGKQVLPPEILLLIASHCSCLFSDTELWFNLSRVSRLFREAVESTVTANRKSRYALLLKHEFNASKAPARAALFVHDTESPYLCFRLSHFDSEDSTKAIFACESGHSRGFKQEELDKLLSRRGTQRRTGFEGSTMKLRHPENLEDGSANTGSVDVGDPVSGDLVPSHSEEEDPKLFLAFDWRKVWTMRLKHVRRYEERQAALKGKEPKGRKMGKDAKRMKERIAERKKQSKQQTVREERLRTLRPRD